MISMGSETVPRILDATDAAYLAGLIDGEGSITLYQGFKKGSEIRSYRPIIEISNTHRGVLEWVKLIVGDGWLAQTNPKNTLEKGHKPLYRVRIRTTDLRWLLPQIRPYLKIKGQQADLLMTYFERIVNTRPESREFLAPMKAEFRALNKRGA